MLLPWPVPPTNFAPPGGRAWTTPWGCGWVWHSSGRVLAEERYPSSRRPSHLSKLILVPATSSFLLTAFFITFMSDWWDTKTVISSAYAETFALTQPPKRTPRRGGFGVQSLRLQSRGPKARPWRRGNWGQPCQTDHSSANASERSLFTCITAWGLRYHMPINLRNSSLNQAVFKTIAKNWLSTRSKTLDWSKLIHAALVLSFNPFRTSHTRCKLSWIDLPFTD